METSIYDPNRKKADAFSMANMVEAKDKKVMTANEREKLNKINILSLFPVSFIGYFAAQNPLDGWLICDGTEISRSTYHDLYSIIGIIYGSGDGATTFNLPDLRGEFIRGLDLGRNVDTGRTIGSAQNDAIRDITGSFSAAGEYGFDVITNSSGAFYTETAPMGWKANTHNITMPDSTATVKFSANRVVPTAGENRPRNIALLPCIKY